MPYCPYDGSVYQIQTINNEDVFICMNCGKTEKIQPGTLIFTKNKNGFNKKTDKITNEFYDVDYKIKNPVLLNTRNYICPNKECETHKHPELRRAVIERDNYQNYSMRYICSVCKTSFIPNYLSAGQS